MVTSSFTVQGMTCEHCERAVSQELGALTGVRDVRVDLAGGRVSVTSDAPLDRTAVREAVVEAGYELVDD